MTFRKNTGLYFCLLLGILFSSCDKVDVTFGSTSTLSDPNITYFDNYATTIATYKVDSFITNSHQVFSLGYHYDSTFGVFKAGAYAQVAMPATNPVLNVSVTFDSLELILNPSGQFYGDSTRPMKVNVYRLTQNIRDIVNGDVYYNTESFAYDPAGIGQQIINLNGTTGTSVHVRLSDALGQDLLTKFKTGDDAVSSSDKFVDYFRGIYVTTDSTVTNSLAFFSNPADSMLIKLSYHENSIYPIAKTMSFTYTSAKQFNNIAIRYTNPNFASFIPNKAQVIESASSGGFSYLNATAGDVVKISFPSLLSLKELHPYIKVVKAELVIKPDYRSMVFPYQLPKTLNLYSTDQYNSLGVGTFETGSTTLQTGDLVIDNLYGQNTYYSYDITTFINAKITEGQFSTSALLLRPTLGTYDVGAQRLVLNTTAGSQSVQLKLYVLGL